MRRVLVQHPYGAPDDGVLVRAIPGGRVVAEPRKVRAGCVELSAEQIARLNDLTPATGERHNEANMSTIER